MTDPDERKAANRAVLEWAAHQVGVSPDALAKEGQSA